MSDQMPCPQEDKMIKFPPPWQKKESNAQGNNAQEGVDVEALI